MRERINTNLKQAMKAKDPLRLSTLRLISAAIKDNDIAARGQGQSEGVSDDDILLIFSKMIKQRQDSVQAYEEAGRLDSADKEREEIEVIREFLPRQLDDAEVEAAIGAAIDAVGAQSIRDMGRVMGALKSKYASQMDFSKAGGVIKSRLSAS